jgi:hypothetical protein
MNINIQVLSNATRTNTLLHPPIVSLDGGTPQSARCSTLELLDYLKSAGASENEIRGKAREIEDNGRTTFESSKINEAELKRVLESPETSARY